MSFEEIIEELDKLARKHEVCAGSPSLKPLAETYRRTAKILRAAIEKLKTHPDNQPNEPLKTAEELREMDGCPAWDTHFKVWGLVDVGLGVLITRKGDVELNVAAATKVLYRRPPEEAQK